jgi:Mg2+ and Co2+ transporter CorA
VLRSDPPQEDLSPSMLRSELPFAIDTGPGRVAAVALGEPLLGFLAIAALALTLFPMLFTVTPAVDAAIEVGQWAIIAWFSVELAVAFACAADKRQFVANPWRWLDFATILLALGSLLPSATAALRSAPILRLARIGRLVSFGVRASSLPARQRIVPAAAIKLHGPAQVMRLLDQPQPAMEPAALDELAKWLAAPDEQWFHVAGAAPEELRRIGAAAGLPEGFLEQHLFGTNYPHWAPAGSRTGLFIWLPELDATGHLERFAILLVPTGHGLLSLSRRALPGAIAVASPPLDGDERSFIERMVARMLERVVRDYQHLAGRCEERLRELEEVPVHESRPAFFELTFRMKKQLSAAQSDLWRLKRIADDLVARRGASASAVEVYTRFENDVDYLYDTMMNVREGVLSVIDLHLNVVSFEMNRVMRVLAVVSALGLIPAIIGGLLGMNLVDTPWLLTLPQVAFGVFFGMVIGLYFFVIKGWLR